MEYTKDKWEISKGIDGAVVYGADAGTITSVPMDLQAWEANAHLIAAAPDLYEALLQARDDLRGQGFFEDSPPIASIDKALAKAEGA